MKSGLLLLSLILPTMAMPQRTDHPFTERELYQALRLVVPDTEAVAMARRAVTGVLQSEVAHLPPVQQWITGTTFSPDVLVLLSLQSPELSEKVEGYEREVRGGRPRTPGEQRDWDERRERWRKWLAAERPKSPPG